MSVLYGDQRIEHRLRDSGAKVLVTDSANRARVPEGLAEMVFVIDSPEARGERSPGDFDLMAELGRASDRYEPADTAADDPAQLYYSSGTTGLAKGILHAHRYLLPTRSSSSATTSMTASSFTAWASGPGPPAYARCSGRGATALRSSCTRAAVASTPTSSSISCRSTVPRTSSRRLPPCVR